MTKLAKKYKTSVTSLTKENLLSNPDRILIGPKITLPDESIPHLKYKVKSEDTLWALSRSYHTTVRVLASFNELTNPDLILVNQVLLVPVTE